MIVFRRIGQAIIKIKDEKTHPNNFTLHSSLFTFHSSGPSPGMGFSSLTPCSTQSMAWISMRVGA